MSNFIIHALPRSRTAWLSKFLTYKDHLCGHEVAMTFKQPEDYKKYFTGKTGASETGAAQGWWLIQHSVPDIRTVVVLRPVEEVVDSMMQVDVTGVAVYDRELLEKHMKYGHRVLQRISERSDVLTVTFDSLKKLETCSSIFEHCLPYKFDLKWWASLKNQNIQVNVKDTLRYYYKHKDEIDEFKRMCKKELIHLRRTDPNNPLWKRA